MRGGLRTLNARQLLVVAHDLVATAAAILASFYLRFEVAGLAERIDMLLLVLPGFLLYAAGKLSLLARRNGSIMYLDPRPRSEADGCLEVGDVGEGR
jgi:hypothetical protein